MSRNFCWWGRQKRGGGKHKKLADANCEGLKHVIKENEL